MLYSLQVFVGLQHHISRASERGPGMATSRARISWPRQGTPPFSADRTSYGMAPSSPAWIIPKEQCTNPPKPDSPSHRAMQSGKSLLRSCSSRELRVDSQRANEQRDSRPFCGSWAWGDPWKPLCGSDGGTLPAWVLAGKKFLIENVIDICMIKV